MAWLLAEDKALKLKFQGVKVQDTNAPVGGRPAMVKYWMPETERSDFIYPAITIRHSDIQKDSDREHRGRIDLGYSPEGFDPVTITDGNANYRSGIYGEFPIPYNLDYEIEVLTRTAQHDIYLAGLMLQPQYLSARFAYLEIPEDGTVRSLFLLGNSVDSEDTRDQDGKRLFSRRYLIRIATELVMSPHTIAAVEEVIAEVNTWNM